MNIFEKLQDCRLKLSKADLKKSGANTYAKYKYFELGDFLPKLTELMAEDKLTSVITFDEVLATLTLIDCEKPEDKIVFTSPMREANLKGMHPIQNLGAVETYSRRYLYMVAFDIVENDTLDSVQQPQNSWQQTQTTQKAYLCHDCGKPFQAFTSKKGKFFNAGQVYHLAENNALDRVARCSQCLAVSGQQKVREDS
jgi:protein-arginine kinase activator protein McsA